MRYFDIRKNRKVLYHRTSIAHLNIQFHLKSLIPEIVLEKPFPSLGRIADAVWEKHKIVFEIQCSLISKEEAKNRCLDYQGAGYTPVWILYTKRFNKKKLTPAEVFLRKGPLFFTDGFRIYDQFDIVSQEKRLFSSPPLLVNLAKPLTQSPSIDNQLLAISCRSWPVSFEGDLLHRASCGSLSHFAQLEKDMLRHSKSTFFSRFYKEIFYNLLSNLTD